MRSLAASPLAAWIAVLAWATVMFVLSGTPHLAVAHGVEDTVLRKLAHVGEYALLTVLTYRALSLSLRSRIAASTALAAAGALALAYAASDEWHQSFVAGRNGTPRDVAIDAAGIALGALAAARIRRALGVRPA